MPLDNPDPLASGIIFVFKIGFIILAILYFLFSLIVVRQVKLMTETLITAISPLLKTFSLLHALAALGLIIYFVLS